MFSYGSNKNSQTTLQNDLIEEIQYIANQIFDPHSFSYAKTELQEMSLQLSPTTSQQADSQIQIHHQNDNVQLNYFTNIAQNQKPFQHPFSKNKPLYQLQKETYPQLKDQKELQLHSKKQQLNERLTKSMISSNQFKEPGSFSNNYLKKSNIAASQFNEVYKKSEMNSQIQKQKLSENQACKEKISENQVLVSSNMNKSNILKGLVNQNDSTENKKGHKKGKFSQSYSSNYISPYSTRGMKQNPKSYMDKSISLTKKSKQVLQIQYMKQKINQNIEPQISHRIQKSQNSKSKNSKLSHVKSKYKQTKPLIHQYQVYADQHIYKQIKQQMSPWYIKNKQYQIFSQQQIQNNWKSFIQNERNFVENKKQWLAAKKLQKFQQEKIQLCPSSNLKSCNTDRNSTFQSNPHKMTPQDFIKKYKRQKDKLKQKLQTNQISNFLEKTYFDSVKYAASISDNKNKRQKQRQNQMVRPSILSGQQQTQQNILRRLLIQNKNSQVKNGQQNFFISIGQEAQNIQTKYSKNNHSHRKNNILTQSSVYYEKGKSTQKKTSRDSRSQRLTTERSSKKENVNNFTPFKGRQKYFSKQESIVQRQRFSSRKHDLHSINQEMTKRKSKQGSKNKQSFLIKELVNPKYFKSITEMQEYSSNIKQRKSNIKRTLLKNDNKIEQDEQMRYDVNLVRNENKNEICQQKQRKKQNQKIKHKGNKFDQNLMNQIIEDLNNMRSQIQENKKNRKYKIQNYSNFTNIRQTKKQSNIKQTKKQLNVKQTKKQSIPQRQTGFFNLQVRKFEQQKDNHQNYHKKDQTNELIQRFNNHFDRKSYKNKAEDLINQPQRFINKSEDDINRSRSISPIRQENTILERNGRQQVSVNFIDDQRSRISWNLSHMNRQFENSNIIVVKDKKQLEFMVQNQKESEKND